MPPNYDEIPKPDTLKEKKLKEKDVKSILKIPSQNKSLTSNTSTEKLILDKIKLSGKE